MKRILQKHGPWALITISTFLLGAHWSRQSEISDVREAQAAEKRLPRTRSHSAISSRSSSASKYNSKSPASSARSARDGHDRAAGSPGSIPLGQQQIESLVRDSVKSGSPVQSRLAFDRLLQQMQASGFTPENALAIRQAMREHGATGEQWKLFDYAWGASQPEAAIAHLEEMPPEAQNGFLHNMIPGLASENPQMAIDLFASLEPDLQARIRPRFLEGLVDNDIALATDYLYRASDPENPDWRPMDQLAREIERDRGLDSALAWAADLPEGSLRSNAWSAAYAVWARQDPFAAIQSITEMAPSSDRDLALNGFVSSHAGDDGERATAWAAQIASPGLREAALIRAGTQYFRQDQSAASAWFASSGLPVTALNRMNRNSGQ